MLPRNHWLDNAPQIVKTKENPFLDKGFQIFSSVIECGDLIGALEHTGDRLFEQGCPKSQIKKILAAIKRANS